MQPYLRPSAVSFVTTVGGDHADARSFVYQIPTGSPGVHSCCLMKVYGATWLGCTLNVLLTGVCGVPPGLSVHLMLCCLVSMMCPLVKCVACRADPGGAEAARSEGWGHGPASRASDPAGETGVLGVSEPGPSDQGHPHVPALQVEVTHRLLSLLLLQYGSWSYCQSYGTVF